MSVTLSTSPSSVESEYAATSIAIQRSMQPDANGYLQPAWTGQLAYSRTDYLVDGNGNKTATIQRTILPAGPGVPPGPDPNNGWISLASAQVEALQAAGTGYNAAVDALVHADLVNRGLLTAPVAPTAS